MAVARRAGGLSGAGLGLLEDVLSRDLALRVKVTGGSMVPFLLGGETLTIRKVPVASLKRGDIVFLKNRDGRAIVHRIVRMRRACDGGAVIQTKGDALSIFDEPVREHGILGKVTRVETGSALIDMETATRSVANFLSAVLQLWRARLCRSLRVLGSIY
ncbi:MAG: S24/S26 family peptidase [Nitrospirae bacterium]|nr:S24/S26 family peptidase [Nitrospirota bacterium]